MPRPRKTRKKKFQQKPLASPKIFPYNISSSRGRSSAGRALDWQSRGQGFDSPRLHHRECKASGITEAFFICRQRVNQCDATPTPTPQKVAQFIPTSVQSLLTQHNSFFAFHIVSVVARAVRANNQARINLRQCEQVCKITPLSTANERYVVACDLN